ncbi:Mu transposase C-terminal domain-containing protein [Rugamonas sp.]|uniref:Mu transposase C-terminal domain-containing protein n=1 Tax=Rugamonas sp. TaxID=1926287 RepID=UPI0025CDAF2E|nr:Mu transposase C-terminal domain-containing protein [Rugamonas sp.]
MQYKLLPSEKAVVTENGIAFRNCYYTCTEAIQKGWFTQARKRRFDIEVSFDPRFVNSIYIRDDAGKKYIRADLTDVSNRIYGGLSFAEVHFYKQLENKTLFEAEQVRQQEDHKFVRRINVRSDSRLFTNNSKRENLFARPPAHARLNYRRP